MRAFRAQPAFPFPFPFPKLISALERLLEIRAIGSLSRGLAESVCLEASLDSLDCLSCSYSPLECLGSRPTCCSDRRKVKVRRRIFFFPSLALDNMIPESKHRLHVVQCNGALHDSRGTGVSNAFGKFRWLLSSWSRLSNWSSSSAVSQLIQPKDIQLLDEHIRG